MFLCGKCSCLLLNIFVCLGMEIMRFFIMSVMKIGFFVFYCLRVCKEIGFIFLILEMYILFLFFVWVVGIVKGWMKSNLFGLIKI